MPLFNKICRGIERPLSRFTAFVGTSVAWLTAVMAAVTTVIVVLRFILNQGSVGSQESITYMHALVIMLAGAYTLQESGHVRVDIFYRRFRPVQKAWIDALGAALLLLPFALFTVAISWDYVLSSWAVKETSADAGGIPAVFLLKALLLASGGLLALQAVAELARNLLILTQIDTADG